MLSDLYRSSSKDGSPLRVGLLLDSPSVSAAVAEVIHDITRSDFARIELLVYNSPSQSPVSPPARASRFSTLWRILRDRKQRRLLAWTLYNKLDLRFSRIEEDPLAEIDCTDILCGIEALRVTPITKGFVHRFPSEAIEEIRASDLDVLLRFGFNILRGDILSAARYGIWSFHHGDNDYYRGGPAHFWEMYEHNPLVGVILQVLTDDLDAGTVLIKGLFHGEPGISLRRNRLQPYWGSTHFVIEKLWQLHRYGWEHVQAKIIPSAPYLGKRKIYRTPDNTELMGWVVPPFIRKTSGRVWRILRRDQKQAHWRMAFRPASGTPLFQSGHPGMRGFQWVESPAGQFYADPFLVEVDSKHWIFFENYSYVEKRGVLSCAELSADGRLDTPRLALDTGKHASYPYIFSENGSIYMVPETREHEVVFLFRCVRFPDEWKVEAELFHGSAVDTSLCKHNGLWWFFVTVLEPRGGGLALYLFFSRSLTGNWQYHPANPISVDVRNARGAGGIRVWDGKLIRPSQDCSRRYGYAINFAEILKLGPTQYEERSIVTLTPDWQPGLLAMHTYNRAGSFEVIDGLTLRSGRAFQGKPTLDSFKASHAGAATAPPVSVKAAAR